MSERSKRELPAFASEAEEAQWWFDNREMIGDEFVQAIKEGRATRGAMLKRGILRTQSIPIASKELSPAMPLADKKRA